VALVIIASVWACGGPPAGVSEAQFGGTHKAYLAASYLATVMAMDSYASADVPDGSAGTLRVDGPLSWTCPGVFRVHPPLGTGDFTDLPLFEVAGVRTLQFQGPTGRYTFTLALPAQRTTVKRVVEAGPMARGADGSYAAPAGCIAT
jgi:hypothetical protein